MSLSWFKTKPKHQHIGRGRKVVMLEVTARLIKKSNNRRLHLSDQSKHYAEFSVDAGFNSGFNPKDNVTLQFSIILSLVLIVVFNADFHTEHQTKL